ncbi:hypothetical protein AM499_15230 [Bacillus sp. FJAT-22090]|uniref:amino acid ABC transporter permease n=1 Tax=Bacillus sp. FJAT-22090 TaxID=1581038 RepID=UPI0006AE96EE|nr:ABC transporter permease subunit [Bacillus sp. FJAT-22090]ALC87023.1 hypothetical protein AM499_15230 [Bacillus sp. FJAT-22090]
MFDIGVFLDGIFEISKVVPKTLLLAITILLLALIMGAFIHLIVHYKVPFLSQVIVVLQSFLRGTPNVVLLFFMFAALPEFLAFITGNLGIPFDANKIEPVFIVILTFSISLSVFQSEIIRGAILSVDPGQNEAAHALGYSFWQTLRKVTLPQALIAAFPDIMNSLLVIIKGLSLAYLFTVIDILGQAKLLGGFTQRYLEAFTAAALIYWGLCILLTKLANKVEFKMREGFN